MISLSPDLNPIEDLWVYFVLKYMRMPSAIVSEWVKIELTTFQKLVRSMARRSCMVKVHKGNTIRY